MKLILGIQGGQGSFSEQAANIFIKKNALDVEILYLISSEEVLRCVESGECKYGIFAMENAQGGIVLESIEALAKYRCKIVERFHIPISQNLLALSGVSADQITEVHSHRQALRQCKDYLSENFWMKKLVESDDTAEAARRLSEGVLSDTIGVIGSKSCATLYNLSIIEEDIHDLKNNLTLFLCVTKMGV